MAELPNGRRWHRPLGAVGAGAVVGLLLVLAVTPTAHSAVGASHASAVPPLGSAMTDPQFLPEILTGATPAYNGQFGTSVAVGASQFVVGEPNISGYNKSGYPFDGVVVVTNPSTGASTTLTSPFSYFGGAFGAAVAIGGGRIVVGEPTYDESGAIIVFSTSGKDPYLASYVSPDAFVGPPRGDFGAAVAVSGNEILVGAPGENASVGPGSGHAYLINAATGAITMLSDPDPQIGAHFGASVAISGNSLLVGAPNQTGTGRLGGAGAVYAFSVSSGNLIGSISGALGDALGFSVALNGSRFALGAPNATVLGVRGAGLIEVGSLTNLHDVQEVFSPTRGTHARFGESVSLNYGLVLAGAPGQAIQGIGIGRTGSPSGFAYLFSTGSSSEISSVLAPPDWPAGGKFGFAVALGSTTALVGAPNETAGGEDGGGHAFYFTKIPLVLQNPPNTALKVLRPDFGASVAVSGDIVIGAPNTTVDGYTAGAAYLATSHGGPYINLTAPPLVPVNDTFGFAVAASAASIAVTALNGTVGMNDEGAVELYTPANGSPIAKITSTDPQNWGYFGFDLATNGVHLAVGSPGENGSKGAVYVYSATNGARSYNVSDPSAVAGDRFGTSVAMGGSFLLVGEPGWSSDRGRVLAYNASTGKLITTIDGPAADLCPCDFGASVAVGGGVAAVGAPDERFSTDAPAGDYGGVYTYSTTSWLRLEWLHSSEYDSSGQFGHSVAINAGVLAVGAPGETAYGASGAGNVYVYTASSGALLARDNDQSPDTNDTFGVSVAIGPGGAILAGGGSEETFVPDGFALLSNASNNGLNGFALLLFL